MFRSMVLLAALAAAGAPSVRAENAGAAWKQLLTLAGIWEGSYEKQTTTVAYTVISGGSALMESMKMPDGSDMVTIYHRDGDGLVATHYCSVGNQPRMRAAGASADGKSIRFRFADITNLKPGAGHIKHLTVMFGDAGHFSQEWTSVEKGKETALVFKWTRKQGK